MASGRVPDEMETGELAVHIVSDEGAKDHVLLLARHPAGVRVREWHSGNWSTGPEESVVSANALITRPRGASCAAGGGWSRTCAWYAVG